MITRLLSLFLPFCVVMLFLARCPAQQSYGSDPLTTLSNSLQKVIAKVTPAIVTVDVTGYRMDDDDDSDSGPALHHNHLLTKTRSLGSGVILDPSGFIITNAHVVEGAKRVRVTLDQKLRGSQTFGLSTGSTVFDARIVGVFEPADVAVLKIEATGLPIISIGNSDAIRPGQFVFAIGSPEGLANSVSMGVVSAVGRDSETDETANYIQTDAAINPGSSGGALVDANGDLIGITTFIMAEPGVNTGLGFALPSKTVREIFLELIHSGQVNYGDIGIRVQNITPTLAIGLELSQDWGIVVSDVAPGSSAQWAGVRVKDLVLSVNGTPVTSVAQFAASFYGKRVGDHVRLDLVRGLRRFSLKVRVVAHPPDSEKLPGPTALKRGLVERLGVVCAPVNAKHARDTSLRSASSVLVIAKLANSEIKSDLLPGDAIRSVNGTPVTSVDGLRSVLDSLDAGTSAVLQIERHRQLQFVPIEID